MESLDTIFTYDYAKRQISKENPDGSTESKEYYPNGLVEAMTDGNGNSTYYQYDGLNRLSEEWTPMDDTSGITEYAYKKITYDKSGRQKQIFMEKN